MGSNKKWRGLTGVNHVRDVLINRNAVPKHVKTELSE